MESEQPIELAAEKLLRRTVDTCKKYRYAIFGSLITAFFAYMFVFTNKLLNHDELSALFSKGATSKSGRWGLELMSIIMPDYSMPWLYGVLSVLLITGAVCLIVRMLMIESPVLQLILGGLIIVFPSLIGTFSYMFTSSSYAMSFLLATLSAYLAAVKGKRWYLPAAACLVLSLSIYQSYICVAASLLVLYLIRRVLYTIDSEKDIFLQGICFVALLAVSMAAYWGITNILWAVSGEGLTDYANSSVSFDLANLPISIAWAYLNFGRTFILGFAGLIISDLSRIAHLVCLLVVVSEVLYWVLKVKKMQRRLLALFLLLIFPLSVNCIFLFTSRGAIHTLVLYGFVAVYALAAVVVDCGRLKPVLSKIGQKCRTIALDVVVACMALVVVCNTYFSNEASLKLYLQYENTYSFCNSIVTQIQATPGYTPETRIAMLGNADIPDFYEEEFAHTDEVTGLTGLSPNCWSRWYMFEYYTGFTINVAEQSQIDEIIASEEYAAMPVYPSNGYIQMIEDVLVVKLSQ